MTDYQNALVLDNLDLVNWVIRTRISIPNRPLLTYDDFYAIGCEAICRAALKYNADTGEFAPFACRYACGFVGLTGIPSYAQYERALEELDAFGVKRINIMVDSDYQVKEEVRKARGRYIEMGAAAGFEMTPITWTQKQKGVDDLYKHLFRDK